MLVAPSKAINFRTGALHMPAAEIYAATGYWSEHHMPPNLWLGLNVYMP